MGINTIALVISSSLGKLFPDKAFLEWSAVGAAVLLFMHTRLTSDGAMVNANALQGYRSKLDAHKWLLSSIQELITRKISRIKEHRRIAGEDEYKRAAFAILDLLREFYSRLIHNPDEYVEVVFFQPSEDNSYLEQILYATPDTKPTPFFNDADSLRVHFSIAKGQTMAVRAWRDQAPLIAENKGELLPLFPGQKIESMIAYPLVLPDPNGSKLIGVITVSTRTSYFKKQDIELHEYYLSQFALRILFEYQKINMGVKPNN